MVKILLPDFFTLSKNSLEYLNCLNTNLCLYTTLNMFLFCLWMMVLLQLLLCLDIFLRQQLLHSDHHFCICHPPTKTSIFFFILALLFILFFVSFNFFRSFLRYKQMHLYPFIYQRFYMVSYNIKLKPNYILNVAQRKAKA